MSHRPLKPEQAFCASYVEAFRGVVSLGDWFIEVCTRKWGKRNPVRTSSECNFSKRHPGYEQRPTVSLGLLDSEPTVVVFPNKARSRSADIFAKLTSLKCAAVARCLPTGRPSLPGPPFFLGKANV